MSDASEDAAGARAAQERAAESAPREEEERSLGRSAAPAVVEAAAPSPVTSAPGPARRRPRKLANPIAFMGRQFPRASGWERGFWVFVWLSCLAVLLLASVVLNPDASGIGTHEQLGFPPCGFVQMFGGPCPSCGFTTTFTLAAHFRPIDALVNQPFGLFLFALTAAAVLVLPIAIVKRISLMVVTERWPWWRIGIGLLLAWLACWAYKWQAMGL